MAVLYIEVKQQMMMAKNAQSSYRNYWRYRVAWRLKYNYHLVQCRSPSHTETTTLKGKIVGNQSDLLNKHEELATRHGVM